MSTLQERIAKVIEAGYTQAAIARMSGATTGAVAQWVTGETQSIQGKYAFGIEDGTDFSARWLITGKPPEMRPKGGTNSHNALRSFDSHLLCPLPVVEWEKGDEMLSVQNDAVGGGDFLTAPGVRSPRAKFFQVPDDSMAPDILRGEFVALDPDQEPSRGDYVLIKHSRTGELMLRQYRPIDLEEFNAVPLNTSKFDPFNSRQHGLELLATLVGHWSGRRSERR